MDEGNPDTVEVENKTLVNFTKVHAHSLRLSPSFPVYVPVFYSDTAHVNI